MKREYLGRWRIVEMEQWDQDYIDMEVPGYILFEENNSGEFQFGLVRGYMDCRIEPYGDSERLAFSWDGEDEMDPVSGRGWAISTRTKLFIHRSTRKHRYTGQNLRREMLNKYPPAKPEVLRLLAPQRGLIAIAKAKPKTEKTTSS